MTNNQGGRIDAVTHGAPPSRHCWTSSHCNRGPPRKVGEWYGFSDAWALLSSISSKAFSHAGEAHVGCQPGCSVLMSSTPLAYPQVISCTFASFRVPKFGVLAGQFDSVPVSIPGSSTEYTQVTGLKPRRCKAPYAATCAGSSKASSLQRRAHPAGGLDISDGASHPMRRVRSYLASWNRIRFD